MQRPRPLIQFWSNPWSESLAFSFKARRRALFVPAFNLLVNSITFTAASLPLLLRSPLHVRRVLSTSA